MKPFIDSPRLGRHPDLDTDQSIGSRAFIVQTYACPASMPARGLPFMQTVGLLEVEYGKILIVKPIGMNPAVGRLGPADRPLLGQQKVVRQVEAAPAVVVIIAKTEGGPNGLGRAAMGKRYIRQVHSPVVYHIPQHRRANPELSGIPLVTKRIGRPLDAPSMPRVVPPEPPAHPPDSANFVLKSCSSENPLNVS